MSEISISEDKSENVDTNYVFLSWYRQGMSTVIDDNDSNNDDDCKSENGRARIKLQLKVNEDDDDYNDGYNIDKTIELIGPGDIKSLNDKVITRVDPKNNIGDFEPNYFPIIEFSEADFPWRYTPIQAKEIEGNNGQINKRLKPWICLIVLEAKDETKTDSKEEFTLERSGTSKTLPSIKVKKNDEVYPLPDLDEIWAWAHVQITADGATDKITKKELKSITKDHPEEILSRIICPRWLKPRTLYNVFLVPTFETGRIAGLGLDINDMDIDKNAWDVKEENGSSDQDGIEIPYYYKWEFRTGLRGDFEHLVRLLKARTIDKRVGTRQMDCSNHENPIPKVSVSEPPEDDPKSVLRLEGALRAVTSETTRWPEGSDDGVPKEYVKLLNLADDLIKDSPSEPPIVVPPIYAKWHAMRNRLKAEDRPWINQLNLDPRYRTIAGFGTSVIQEQQESLMHSAWKQIGEIEEANELLRIAQLSQIVSTKIYEKNIKPLSTTALLGMCFPLTSRIIYDGDSETEKITLKEKIKSSKIKSTMDPAFLKIFRRRGPIKKRAKAEEKEESYIDRINKGEIKGDEGTKSHSPSIKDISEDYRPSWAKGLLWKFLKPLGKILLILALAVPIFLWISNQFAIILSPNHDIIIILLGIILAILGLIVRRYTTSGIVADNVTEENLTPEFVESIPPRPNFTLTEPGNILPQNAGGGQDSLEASIFRAYVIDVQGFLSFIPPEQPEPEKLDLSQIQGTIVNALNPKFTIANRVKRRVLSDLIKSNDDKITLPMAAPVFEQPMYIPLRDKSQELLLSGLKYVSQNTIGLLKENRKFIESYMCGCSHEMARELLWREYPTDQRGTYFRQFWDVSDAVMLPDTIKRLQKQVMLDSSNNFSDMPNNKERSVAITEKIKEAWKEELLDIEKIHKWTKTNLGDNATKKGGEDRNPNAEKLVLLIRGDLLKKYPSTVIYAKKAKWICTTSSNPSQTLIHTRWPMGFPDHETRCDDPKMLSIITPDNSVNVKMPIFKGILPPDVTFFGFELTVEKAKGSTKFDDNNPGWFFVIEERISESRFGVDVDIDNNKQASIWAEFIPATTLLYSDLSDNNNNNKQKLKLDTWNDLSWKHLVRSSGDYIQVNPNSNTIPSTYDDNIKWGENSSSMAYITFQKPFRMAIHADDMLPKEGEQ